MASSVRGPYRSYLYDSSKLVPRTTSWRIKKTRQLDEADMETSTSCEAADNEEQFSDKVEDASLFCDSWSLQHDDMHFDYNNEGISDRINDTSSSECDEEDEDDIDDNVTSDSNGPDLNFEEYQSTTGRGDSEDIFSPLYPGANISICGAYCAIMHLQSKLHLPFSTVREILHLLKLLCPSNSKLPSSVYILKKFFSKYQSHQIKTEYCSNCHDRLQPGKSCSNSHCACATHDSDVFIEMDMKIQLQTILSRHSKDIQCFSPDSSHEITHSTPLSHEKEFFSSTNHVGVVINTDGVALFKSSRVTMWPIYLEIVNVPPAIRFRDDNTVICGIWVGKSKPDMSILLSSTLESIDRLNIIGFEFIDATGKKSTIRIKLLIGIFDLVAKAKVLNMVQFNGNYGCPTCLHPGVHLNNRHLYLPDSIYPMRTLQSITRALEEGERNGLPIEGIKGASVLHGYLHLVNSVPADYMHCVLEGVTKSLLTFWTSPKYSRQPFSIRRQLNEVDAALCKQTPPSEITRSPRSIAKDLSYWKASEFRSWLLFYSLPLLYDVLPPLYFHHFSLLVCAMHILLQKTISVTECGAAEEMLNDFYGLLPELYGENSCTMNAHTLTHLVHFVRLWGPCWSQSAFSFESHNGSLKRAINSTRKVAEQLTLCLNIKVSLQSLYNELEMKESQECLNFLDIRRHSHSTMTKVCNGYAIGKIECTCLPITLHQELKKLYVGASHEVKTFHKLLLNDFILQTHNYRDSLGKFCNSYCSYKQQDGMEMYGKIHMLVECSSAVGTVAFVKQLQTTSSNILKSSGRPCRDILDLYSEYCLISNFIIEVNETIDDLIVAISVKDIISKCIIITPSTNSTNSYIVKLPNTYEKY